MDFSLTVLLILFLAGLAAGFIDAIAGGGGLISLPVLLWAGLPPSLALGTNKAQSSFGTTLAVWRYAKAGLLKWSDVKVAVPITFVAALLGAWTLTLINNEQLRLILPWCLLIVAVYVIFSPRLGLEVKPAILQASIFAIIFGSVLGFYDGFFGPGTGAFWTLALVSLAGYTLPAATAYTKVVNLTSNVASLLIFVLKGQVLFFPVAVAMIAGQLIGAQLGAHLAIRHGAKFIRIIFLGVVFALILRLLLTQRT
jgi:uncharacterized membrane protein YfcA